MIPSQGCHLTRVSSSYLLSSWTTLVIQDTNAYVNLHPSTKSLKLLSYRQYPCSTVDMVAPLTQQFTTNWFAILVVPLMEQSIQE